MRSAAPPDNTGCVAYAITFLAPNFLSAAAASQSVFAVSTMSSIITQVRPVTSPIMFITLATFGFGRRLSIIAKSEFNCLAAARARTTPPTSGETTIKLS